jgi:hypothetical protein
MGRPYLADDLPGGEIHRVGPPVPGGHTELRVQVRKQQRTAVR